jgi:predicted nuclease with TOPRIM domain
LESALVVNLSPAERDTLIKSYGFRSVVDVTRKLNDIKNERKTLRTQLDQFQKNFEETHQRKIRYTKDIVPVQHEFKRYKDLKVDIAKLEQIQKFMTK